MYISEKTVVLEDYNVRCTLTVCSVLIHIHTQCDHCLPSPPPSPPLLYSEFCVCMVTVQSRNGPIRNSVLPNHMSDLANFIGLESR